MTNSEQAPTPEEVAKLKKDAEDLKQGLNDNNDDFKRFSLEDRSNLFDAFRAIDADQNWKLSVDELQVFMNECNLDSTFTNLIMRIIDKDGDGGVVFREFLSFISLLLKVQDDSKVLFDMLFHAIDKDNSGFLDEAEIKEFVDLFSGDGRQVDQSEIQAFLKDFGKNNKLSLEQLKNILQ